MHQNWRAPSQRPKFMEMGSPRDTLHAANGCDMDRAQGGPLMNVRPPSRNHFADAPDGGMSRGR